MDKVIQDHYMEEDGRIRSYGTPDSDEYLSESAGLYLQWKHERGDRSGQAEVEEMIRRVFLVETEESAFLHWRIEGEEKIPVNAWIDDRRIADYTADEALRSALRQTAREHQLADGLPLDFYDWEQEAASARVVLSYGPFPGEEEAMRQVYEDAAIDPFFPERFLPESGEYEREEEVHLVDQMLAGAESEALGVSADPLWNWTVQMWEEEDKLPGRAIRATGAPASEVESASVYGTAAVWAAARGEQDLARSWQERAEALVRAPGSYEDVHFFDLIWSQLAKKALE
ncbi:hypothetical protein [Alkalicoccus urumqiensis]|uniref:hypothetical protein n=1 Tax=Alkalicoccus urumqiensis TaxID=1548213 RepID=UPI00115B4E32|nr:hypothetical protein [Alkalicoccus urumqiensis]